MCSSLWMSATSVRGHSTCKAISSIVSSLLSEAAILAGSLASSQAPTAPFIHTPVPQQAALRDTAVVVCSVLIFCDADTYVGNHRGSEVHICLSAEQGRARAHNTAYGRFRETAGLRDTTRLLWSYSSDE